MSMDLKDFFTESNPLGPLTSDVINTPSLIKALLCNKNMLFNALRGNPSLIIGRKGAGKTAFLRLSYINSKNKIIVELKPEKAFRQIVESLNEHEKDILFAEEVSDLWKVLFWNTIFVFLVQKCNNRKYLASEHLDTLIKFTTGGKIIDLINPYSIMRIIITKLKKKTKKGNANSFIDPTERLIFNGVTFFQAKNAAIAFMKDHSLRAEILFDTLDDFQLNKATMSVAISGLMKCQGSFSEPGSRCSIRSCIPAELLSPFMELSINPNKDFRHMLSIRWHAEELLRLAAKRHLQYITFYHQDLAEELSAFDLDKRSDVKQYWDSILPTTLKNRLKIDEKPVAYILRHTQLLPRQLLMYMNAIFRESTNVDSQLKPTPNLIVNSVFNLEYVLCEEIFFAFKYTHPFAKIACKHIIPYLPLHFNEGLLVKLHRSRIRRIPELWDYEVFKKMMLEIGAIGIVEEISERYVKGLFEYTVPHKLVSGTYEELCLHPLFTEVFRAMKPKQNPLVVYPHGTDISEDDWRTDLLSNATL